MPVQASTQSAKVQDVLIDYDQPWVKRLKSLITHNYSKSPYGQQYLREMLTIINNKPAKLSDLNIALTLWIMSILDINTDTILASSLCASGEKTERLISILKQTDATEYLSGPSAKSYIDKQKFLEAGIGLSFKTYEYKAYGQLHNPFDGAVSIFDP